MFKKITYFLLAVFFGIASYSCQSTGSHSNRASKGSSMKLIQWENIPAADSRISIKDGQDLILARREKDESYRGLVSQAYKLTHGTMLFESRKDFPQEIVTTPEQEIISRYGSHPELLSLGLKVKAEDIKKAPGSDLYYAILASPQKECFIYYRYSEDSKFDGATEEEPLHYQAITGSSCASPGSAFAQRLEAEMLALAENVLFDDGKYARQQLLNNALSKLDDLEKARLEKKADTEGPQVLVAETFTADREEVVFEGRVVDDSEIDMVRVNGTWVDLQEDGNFAVSLRLPAKGDFIQIAAIDQFGNRTAKKIPLTRTYTPVERPAEQEIDYGSYHALLIANSSYSQWRDLGTPRYDVQAVGEVLGEMYGFKSQRVIHDASQEEILAALDETRKDMKDTDNLLIFYSGHGVLHRGNGYWVPVDGYLDDPQKWVPNSEISRAIRRNRAKHVIVVADSCYSGTLTAGKIDESVEALPVSRSRTAMSAGGGNEVVLEPILAEGESGNSVFAYKFIDVLKKNSQDVITGLTVFKEIKEMFKFFPQHPEYGQLEGAGHDEDADFFFRKTSSTAAKLPQVSDAGLWPRSFLY